MFTFSEPIVTRTTENRHILNVNIDVEQFYSIVNVMRDACGCANCLELANKLLKSLSESR
jgi:hypothetical protein